MFFDNQDATEQNRYELLLRIIGALSKLSTDSSDIPYLYYRMAENIFCRAFGARNLSRSDISVDASKNEFGIGLKTFLHKNSHCLEKVAEFNKERNLYSNVINSPEQLVLTIADYRNKRISSTCGICSLPTDKLLYHCVTRDKSVLYLHEEPMHLIDTEHININSIKDNTISFSDGIEEYTFNISKSTLYKRFNIQPLHSINVKIFDDPFELLEKFLADEFQTDTSNKIVDTIYLPLYSYKHGVPYVFEKSGLNQWNAAPRRKRNKNGELENTGKERNINEVYIPFNEPIRSYKAGFFPPAEQSFTLNLPNGEFVMAKLCQADGKGLMTNPNKALGKWLLRDVLKLKENEILTYQRLEEIGIDTVQINKFEDGTYEIHFRKIGTFEAYKHEENIT